MIVCARAYMCVSKRNGKRLGWVAQKDVKKAIIKIHNAQRISTLFVSQPGYWSVYNLTNVVIQIKWVFIECVCMCVSEWESVQSMNTFKGISLWTLCPLGLVWCKMMLYRIWFLYVWEKKRKKEKKEYLYFVGHLILFRRFLSHAFAFYLCALTQNMRIYCMWHNVTNVCIHQNAPLCYIYYSMLCVVRNRRKWKWRKRKEEWI